MRYFSQIDVFILNIKIFQHQYIFIHHCLQYALEHFFPHLLVSLKNHNTPSINLPPKTPGYNFNLPNNNGQLIGGSGENQQRFFATTPMIIDNNSSTNGSSTGNLPYWSYTADGGNSNFLGCIGKQPSKIEVHQNPAFIEDDEGIAESGL